MGHSALGTSTTFGETRRGLRVSPTGPIARAARALPIALAVACSRPEPPQPSELETGRRFVTDPSFRREALERSLAFRDNGEARTRLEHYAVAGQWEALPVMNPDVAAVVLGQRPELAPAWKGELTWTEAALLELGRRAFEEWPAQRAPRLTRELGPPSARPTIAPSQRQAIGTWVDDRSRVGGLVWVRYADGTIEPSLTCASCHARPDPAGHLLHGPASDFDLGALVGEAWGAGHVDVTADGRDNPVAIPDLRATRYQRRLHHSGNLHNSLEALAIRTETLLITARENLVRPPREIAFALAFYVWKLSEPPPPEPDPSPLFRDNCAPCHSSPTGAGDLIDLPDIATDGAATQSSLRGTGGYRVPSLHRVSERHRLTHLGWPLTLQQFLAPERLAMHPGHAFGNQLNTAQREELVRELERF